MRRILLAAFAMPLAACPMIEEPIACDTYAAAGVNVKLADSVTASSLGLRNMWARVVDVPAFSFRDSTFAESWRPESPLILGLAWERTGTFLITAGAEGYQEWQGYATVAMKDKCHVQGKLLTARLQRRP